MPDQRLRPRAAVAAGALAVFMAACSGGPTGNTSTEISVAPAGNALVSQDRNPIIARNSPTIVVDPLDANNMTVVDRVDLPDYTAGVHVSSDAGVSWKDIALRVPDGNKGKLFAPSAAYNAEGTLFVSYVTLSGGGNSPDSFWLTRSLDGGRTFDEPSRVAGAHTFQTTIAVDQRNGRLFAAWVQSNPKATMCNRCYAETGIPIVVSRSDDDGRTWSPPGQVSDGDRARVGAVSLAVGPDGNPAVLYMDYGTDRADWENLPGTYDGKFTLVLARSNDEGLRFEPGVVVDADIVPPGRFLVYLPVSPALAIGRNGDMVAVWADSRNGDADVLLRRSTDGGRTWSAPIRVNRGTPGDGVPQDLPAVDIAPGGRVDVVYYDRTLDRRGSTADILLSSSSDGGQSFSTTVRLSTASSNRRVGPETSPHATEADFGTQISVRSLPRGAIAAWTDTRNGTLDTGKQDIFAGSFVVSDDQPIGSAVWALAVSGALLGPVGAAVIVRTRRSRKAGPSAGPKDPRSDSPPPPPPLVAAPS